MTWVEQSTLIVVAVVVIIGVVSNFSARLGVAAPLLLVVVGGLLSLIPGAGLIEVEPHIILGVILPPLLYATALKMPFVDFRRNLKVISALAVVLVAISAFAAATVVHLAYPAAGFALALALGAVVSPPDAVAAISLGKRLGLPPRDMTILEGEGLVNDATALVLLSTAVGLATQPVGAGVDPWGIAGGFLWAVAGAVAVGCLVGALAVAARARISDPVLDIAIALVVPFVAFLLAEEVDASGIVAVVFAGIWVGNKGIEHISASRRRTEEGNWGTFTMLVENGVFLVMGYLLLPVARELNGSDALVDAVLVGLLVTAVLIAVRFLYVPLVVLNMRRGARAALRRHHRIKERFRRFDEADDRDLNTRLLRRIESGRRRLEQRHFDLTAERDQRLGWRDSVVLGLAGMRGVVTIAAAQTLPSGHPMYHTLVFIAFVVALATLLPQGLLLPFVVRGLRLQGDDVTEARDEYTALMERMNAVAEEASERTMDEVDADPTIRDGFHARQRERRRRVEVKSQWQEEAFEEQFRRIRAAELEAEHAALAEERRRGEFSSETLARAQRVVDDQQIQLEQLGRDA